MDKERVVMTEYKEFIYKGKEYRLRIDGKKPKLEEFEIRGSSYYKEVLKNSSWVSFALMYPILSVIAITILNALGLVEPSDTGALLGIFGIVYFFLAYISDGKLSEAKSILKRLEDRAKRMEYIEAYNAWLNEKKD